MLSFPGLVLSQAGDLRQQIETTIKYENPIDFNVVPGILIGAIDGDSTYRFQFGRDVHPEGLYEIGSVTKPVVAWLVSKALDSLHLNGLASVCSFLPDSLCSPSWQKLTIDDIINHHTGLMRMPMRIGEIENDVRDPYKDYSPELFANDLRQMTPIPGKYSYSNIGYAMTSWLFDKVGGLTSFTNEKLVKPFGMKDTKWEATPEEIAPGYGMDGRPQPPWNTNALAASMGLKSSLLDLMTFVRLAINKYAKDPNFQFSAKLNKELKSLKDTDAYKIVDGWFVIRSMNSIVFYHTGRTGGHQVSVAFIPYLNKGVVIISNGALGSNDLSILILRMLRKEHHRSH